MAPQTATHSASILRSYADKTPGSRALHARATALLNNGVTHVGRYLEPHPVYIERAAGSHKWDVDGNEYVDYFGGHGALILGHNGERHKVGGSRSIGTLCRTRHYAEDF